MHESLSILFASSEVYPFAKSGGLADVAYSLPHALNKEHSIHVVLPLYQSIDRKKYKIKPYGKSFNISMDEHVHTIELHTCNYEGITYIFVYTPQLSDREYLYGTSIAAYEDNDIRFGLFNYVLLEMLKATKYDIVHLNDWQCGLLPLLMDEIESIQTKSIFTIHNLAYQGLFNRLALHSLGIDEKYFTSECLEFYGQVNFMKAAIAFSDAITTVSPTYAKEILTPEFGCGLEGFLQHYSHKLSGIVNGIDTKQFSPSLDKQIVKIYTDLRGKAVNKRALIKYTGFKTPQIPLFAFVGRFTWQKGLDLMIDILPTLARMDCNIMIIGSGDEVYQNVLLDIARDYENVHIELGYNEALAHRLYASSDFFLMPSLFEPCGLAQMIAMNYGSIPIVHHVGGLADTVSSIDTFKDDTLEGYGIVFYAPDTEAFLGAVNSAITLYNNKRSYNTITKHNMLCDFSWAESGELYIKKYYNIIKESYHG